MNVCMYVCMYACMHACMYNNTGATNTILMREPGRCGGPCSTQHSTLIITITIKYYYYYY